MDENRNVVPVPATYRDLQEALTREPTRAVEAAEMVGLLRSLVGLAGDEWRAFLHVGGLMAQGYNRRMACVGSGLTVAQVTYRLKKNPALRDAFTAIEAAGFASVVEGELRSRAFDRNDRGSARLLELYVRAHAVEYRDKAMLEVSVLEKANDSRNAAITASTSPVEAIDQFGAAAT